MIIKGYVSTGYIGSKREFEVDIDREDWESMSFQEREDFLLAEMLENIAWGYHVEDEQ